MTSSSSIVPLVRRSAATTTPVATPAPMMTGTQLVSAVIEAARATTAKPIRTASTFISTLVAEQTHVDRVAHAVNRQKMNFLDARGHGVRHADVDIVGDQEFADSSSTLAGERHDVHAALVSRLDSVHDAP